MKYPGTHFGFERLCRESNIMPVKRFEVPGGIVLIGDGSPSKQEIEEGYSHRTVWAFGRNEDKLEIARPLLFNSWYEDDSLMKPVTQDIRIRAAEALAMDWVKSRGR